MCICGERRELQMTPRSINSTVQHRASGIAVPRELPGDEDGDWRHKISVMDKLEGSRQSKLMRTLFSGAWLGKKMQVDTYNRRLLAVHGYLLNNYEQ